MNKRVDNAFILSQTQKANNSKRVNRNQNETGGQSFKDVIRKMEQDDIKLTRHAQLRLQTRGIDLSPKEIEKLKLAMDEAGAKGVKDAVVVMENKLLIASVANRTIITAAKPRDIETKLITKIDGAIFI